MTETREVQTANLTSITDFNWKVGDVLIDRQGQRRVVTRVEHLPIGPVPWTLPEEA